MREIVCSSEGCILKPNMAPTRYSSGRGGVVQQNNSYLIPLSSLIQPSNGNSPAIPIEEEMDTQTETTFTPVLEKPKAKRSKTKPQTGRGVVQRNDSYLVPLSSVNQLASKIKLPQETNDDGQEAYLVLSISKGNSAAKRQPVRRKGRPPGKNVAATAKRGQVGKGVVQQYESRSIPLKSKGRPTLSRNKKPTNTPARRQKKQQSSSSASSDSESTCETIGNRLNPKYEYVMK